MRLPALLVVLLVCSRSLVVLAQDTVPSKSPLLDWMDTIQQRFTSVAQKYKIAPPVPVSVKWRARAIWTGAFQGELLAMSARDLNGDSKSEIVVLTSKRLLVLVLSRGQFRIQSTAELPQVPASSKSRAPIGSLSIDRGGDRQLLIRARSSEFALGGRYAMVAGQLQQISDFAGYPVCLGGTIQAAPGRNYFLGKSAQWPVNPVSVMDESLPEHVYTVVCGPTGVDPQGYTVNYFTAVSVAGQLRIHCRAQSEHSVAFCSHYAKQTIEGVGLAHLLVDVNHDGYPEIIGTDAGLPNGADRVWVLGREGLKFETTFGHGIVTIAAGDIDGDGAMDVLAAERSAGGKGTTLWLLN